MSVVPSEIPDVGPSSQRLRQNPRFDPLKAGFGTEEYFVWSRFDGATTVKDLILMTGLAIDRAVAIVRQLRRVGALLAPGETDVPMPPPGAGARPATTPSVSVSRTVTPPRVVPPASQSRTPTVPMRRLTPPQGAGTPAHGSPAVVASAASAATASASAAAARPVRHATAPLVSGTASRTPTQPATPAMRVALPLPELDNPTAAERAMHAEPGDLSLDERSRVLVGLRLVAQADPWALVGVLPGADKRVIKRAFFERSKLFHPDRFYGRNLGTWQARLISVFEAISAAHAELLDPTARREEAPATAPQTPAEYAAELFDRACLAEVGGDAAAAVRLFTAAVKLDPTARYLRRAASCALAAGEHQAALDFARKATALDPHDPSTARTLARTLRALDRLDDAEEVLVMALAMKNENDTLGGELAADLGTVRAALARRSSLDLR